MVEATQREDDARKRIPACQRCKAKKTKCDRLSPRCSGCAAAKVACIVIDPVTSKRYARETIQQLEAREKLLQAKLATLESSCPEQTRDTPSGDVIVAHVEATQDAWVPPASGLAKSPRGFVGDGSGLGFLRSIVLDTRWTAYKSQILQHLTERPPNPELGLAPNSQPPLEEATALLDNYFTRFHIQHTFLQRQDVLRIFNTVYHDSLLGPPSSQDLFRLWMIFALSAVSRYRQGASSDHPFGYYLAALPHLANVPLVGSVDAIPNLLLVCRFGMYYNIGTSLWDISQFCMRQCVEQGLHAKPRHSSTDLVTEQHHRCIFWECYILDRWSSGVLDRPFAIAEADITVDMPVDARDEAVAEAAQMQSRLADIVPAQRDAPTDLSVFLFCVRLRRITTRIHSAFYSGRGPHDDDLDRRDTATGSNLNSDTLPLLSPLLPPRSTTGHVYALFYQLLEELETWRRDTAPIFAAPRSLYERPEWYDFLFEKDKLFLVRGALTWAPRRPGGGDRPPQDLLAACVGCATRIIDLFEAVLRRRLVSCTRSYFQVVFVAGLSLVYCASHSCFLPDNDANGGGGGGGGNADGRARCASTLQTCDTILRTFQRELPESGRFAVVFGLLKEQFLRDLASSSASTPAAHRRYQQQRSEMWQSNAGAVQNTLPSTAAVGFGLWQAPEGALLPTSLIHTGDGSVQEQTAAASSYMMPPQDFDTYNMGGGNSLEYNGTMGVMVEDGIDPTWPTLTEEMMEQLEAGLGEFAWGAVGT